MKDHTVLTPTKIKARFSFDFPEELPTGSGMNICSILDQELHQVHVPPLNGNVKSSLAYRDTHQTEILSI